MILVYVPCAWVMLMACVTQQPRTNRTYIALLHAYDDMCQCNHCLDKGQS